MILINDRLAVKALAGQGSAYWPDETLSVAWYFYIRLLTALRRNNTGRGGIARPGKLTRLAPSQVFQHAAKPPPDVLQVVDQRPYAALTVDLFRDHRPNINGSPPTSSQQRNTTRPLST